MSCHMTNLLQWHSLLPPSQLKRPTQTMHRCVARQPDHGLHESSTLCVAGSQPARSRRGGCVRGGVGCVVWGGWACWVCGRVCVWCVHDKRDRKNEY